MLNPLEMTGRTVMVTGASSGIGRETAILLHRLGAKVILVARNEERLRSVGNDLGRERSALESFDLSNYQEIPIWLRRVTARHGPLHGLVHCAGVQMTAPLRVLDADRVENIWRVNVSAALWLVKGYRQRNVNSGGGSVVLLSSVLGMLGLPGMSAYGASKGAVIGMTRSLAMELAREEIRVNCVAAGLVRTEMLEQVSERLSDEHFAELEKQYPLGIGAAVDVAHVVAFLLAPATRWITGSVLVADGGYSCH